MIDTSGPSAPPPAPDRWRNALRRLAPDLALVAILVVAAALRFTGLDWDESNHLHPDERFLTMVETGLRLPSSIGEYFDTSTSGLNPHNVGFGFFVYGTLPIFLVRYLAEWLGQLGYDQVHLIGRATSGVFDLIGLVLMYAVGWRLYNRRVGLLAALIGAFTVLLIQHSHFFVVDPVANVFILTGLYLAIRVQEDGVPWRYAAFGLALGMAVASKISAAPLAGVIALAVVLRVVQTEPSRRETELTRGLVGVAVAAIVSLVAFRVFQPYAFEGPSFFGLRPNPKWLANLAEIRNQSGGAVDVPFALQWAYRPRFLFSWLNMVEWGMGLPLGIVAWAGAAWATIEVLRGRWARHALIVTWTLAYFLWQAAAFNPTLRYQIPVYPTLILLAAWAVVEAWDRLRGWAGTTGRLARLAFGAVGGIALLAHIAYGVGFTSIYTRPVTRVAATTWIYTHVPGPVNLVVSEGSDNWLEPAPLPPDAALSASAPEMTSFQPIQSGTATAVRLPFIRDLGSGGGETILRAEILATPEDTQPQVVATWTGALPTASAALPLSFEAPYPLDAGRTYLLRLSVAGREGVSLDGDLILLASAGEGQAETRLGLPKKPFSLTAGVPFTASFISASGGDAQTLLVPFASAFGEAQQTDLRVDLLASPDAPSPMASAEWSGDLPDGETSLEIALDSAAVLDQGTTYWLRMELRSGVGVALRGSRIISESSWDDGLPLRMDNKDGYGGFYVGLNQELYWPDEQDDDANGESDKLARLVDTLSQGDYLIITSNRQYGSIPRVPIRYPLTAAYYRALFGCPEPQYIPRCGANLQPTGEVNALGYELIQVFQSDPRLGPLDINDQLAEEAFTVYDHPKVLIFARSASFSSAAVHDLLAGVDLSHIVHVLPAEARSVPPDLMLPADRLAEQRAGGTWSELFPESSWINRSQALATLAWWLLVGLLGVAAFPLVHLVFPGFGRGAYALGRAFGLLIWAWGVWVLASWRIPFHRPLIFGVLLALAASSAVLVWRQRVDVRQWWREYRSEILWVEALALGLFLIDLYLRWGNPDLWHPAKGGEKPMDFSYLNAVLRSTSFPPYDPWFAGGYINYYYFGFVIVAVPVKLLGLTPSVAYNLILPTLFSVVGLGAYAFTRELVARARRAVEPPRLSPKVAGLAAAMAIVLLGNLGTVWMIYDGLKQIGTRPGDQTHEMLAGIPQAVRGFGRFLTLQDPLPYRMDEWYWNPSRAIPVVPGDVGPITEFPFFTFLYADLHAHMIALPLTVLGAAWAASWLLGAEEKRRLRAGGWIAGLFAGGLILGALRPTNTWDFPVYLTLGVAAVIVAGPLRHGWRSRQAYVESLISALALVGFFLLLYQPYTRWYGQGYNAADFWTGSRTTIRSYLVVHGLFLFPLMAWMVWETRQWMAATPLSQLARLRPYVGWIVFVVLAALGVVVWGFAQGARITVVAVPLILWGLLLLLRPGIGWSKRVALVFTASALMLTLVVELVVLRGDIGRMNTVFKFYFQVWTLLGLSSVAAAFWTYEELPQGSNGWRTVWSVGLTALVVGAALYPLTAASAKVRDRMAPEAPHTLDGAAYMQNAVYYDLGGELHFDEDARLIHWMQQNVQGSPVIVEANIPEYRWGSRVTVYTGLPGVLGWRWHQTQQRAVEGDPATQRAYEIADFYTNPSIEAAVDFLKRYDVRYVIVASQERLYYEFVSPCTPTVDGLSVTCDMAGRPLGMASPNVPPTDCSPLDPGNPALLVCPTHGIEKFESMVERGLLRVVYHDGAAEVYEVTS